MGEEKKVRGPVQEVNPTPVKSSQSEGSEVTISTGIQRHFSEMKVMGFQVGRGQRFPTEWMSTDPSRQTTGTFQSTRGQREGPTRSYKLLGWGWGTYHMKKIKYQNTPRFLTRSQKTTCNTQKKNYSQLSSQINHPSGGKVEPCLFISVVW